MALSPWWLWRQRALGLDTDFVQETVVAEGEQVTLEAAETLSALRVVFYVTQETVAYADPSSARASRSIAGVTTTAAMSGADVTVARGGWFSDNSWNWAVGELILCGVDGALTQTWDPGWDNVIPVGIAVDTDKMLVRLQEPIVQAG